MDIKVCKFGGTSLADARQLRKVQAIIASDPSRRVVVPSAPGKRTKDDIKITDMLYACHEQARKGVSFDRDFAIIAERYRQIIADLGLELDLDLEPRLDEAKRGIAEHGKSGSADYAASRGEYLNGFIVAALLNLPMIDAAEVIFFKPGGRLDEDRTHAAIRDRLGDQPAGVIPGFYGTAADGQVRTFSRGGSDVTGAIVAAAIGASVYENWTDVDGLKMADPRVVDNPKTIAVVTYPELRELSYMGASVLHDEAVFPVRKAGIPVNIRNTNDPDAAGSLIVAPDAEHVPTTAGAITGIAGRKDFTVIALEKAMMNSEIGFGRRALGVLEDHGLNWEHVPTGIDTLSIVVSDKEVAGKLVHVVDALRQAVEPDSLEVFPNMALIATVGRGMMYTKGMAARLFAALARADVNIRMIDQGSSELNIIVGVEADQYEAAVQAIYDAFVGEEEQR